MTTDGRVGLYVHIPFCVKKCNYCDFASFAPSDGFRERYIDRLCDEIKGYADRHLALDTVFFGGGTPSLLTPHELRRITDAINSTFAVSADAEITAEANPKTLTEERLRAFLDCGFNRFSIGLQSVHENELKKLGRIHNYRDFYETYSMLRRHGVKNVNVDLMFGIPEQTCESFQKTLDEVISLSCEHVSVYGLILEEGTPFFKWRDALVLPSEDDERQMYFDSSDRLSAEGYRHYEISNFAKQGYECRHNLKYWNLDEYIGVGIAAHSYFAGKRFFNPRDGEEYLSGVGCAPETVTPDDSAFEYAMLKLRTADGIDRALYMKMFGRDFCSGKEERIELYEKHGLLKCTDGRISLTTSGFYVSNTILSDIL